MQRQGAGGRRWRHGVSIADRGPGHSYRPDDRPPSVVGTHQPGIASPQLDHVAFGALDVTAETLTDLRELFTTWTAEAERLMKRQRAAPGPVAPEARAHGRPKRPIAGLTVTIGLGPTLFEDHGTDRFGLRRARPLALEEPPAFTGEELDRAICGGDLCVQACARDTELAADALEHLAAAARGAAVMRWAQQASLRRPAGDRPDGTPRNLLGFKDGSDNVRRPKDLDRHVWVTGRERTWMLGGTFLVVRRIRVLLDSWQALSIPEQERVIGRRRETGAPLGRQHEFDALPLEEDVDEVPLIPSDAHARLAAPATNAGLTMLRRSYSYANETDASGAGPDAGVLFLAYQRDPRRQYVPVQRRLADHDALSAFTQHVGSAVFAIPPGARAGGIVGGALLGVR